MFSGWVRIRYYHSYQLWQLLVWIANFWLDKFVYPQICNRQSVWNSWGGWNSRGLDKMKTLIARVGWLLNCFLLSFFSHENYSIKSICVYIKSKIRKVTNRQNLEYLKMIKRRLFLLKFCNNPKMLLSSSWAIFIRAPIRFHQEPTFLRLSTCVFRFY